MHEVYYFIRAEIPVIIFVFVLVFIIILCGIGFSFFPLTVKFFYFTPPT